jgi:hypothetical protein
MYCNVKKKYISVFDNSGIVCDSDFAFFKSGNVGLSNVFTTNLIQSLESINKDIILLIIISLILPLLAK